MLPTKIVVIGAGSASFGLNTLGALMRSERLRGSTLALVDRNPASLETIASLARRLNADWGARMTITTHTHHASALDGAKFVVAAIEVPPREALWRQDWEITLRHGVRQPYSENGGPGGFAHAARNIGPVLEIAHAMEQACPDAWYINFTNPMVRICDAISRYSKIKVVGLCHQIFAGYRMVGRVLADRLGLDPITLLLPDGTMPKSLGHFAADHFDLRAAGLNHFTWMTGLYDRHTGEDLYPLFAERWAAYNPNFEPLTRKIYKTFGLFPVPADTHLCEYLPWTSDPQTKPWDVYDLHLYNWDQAARNREEGLTHIAAMGRGEEPIDMLKGADSEGALEMIENIAGAGTHYHIAANRPNQGQISNLPLGAMVETPVVVNGAGIQPVAMGALPEAVAELLRRELSVVRLCVDAAVSGDRQTALQCLLFSPCITDLATAEAILDDYLTSYREHLPQFFH
jgi:alpha-galactosidase